MIIKLSDLVFGGKRMIDNILIKILAVSLGLVAILLSERVLTGIQKIIVVIAVYLGTVVAVANPSQGVLALLSLVLALVILTLKRHS